MWTCSNGHVVVEIDLQVSYPIMELRATVVLQLTIEHVVT
jgi:hypothetical protein